MKNRTRQLYVMSPGFVSGVAFVTWDSGQDPYQRADEFMPEDETPSERRQGPQRNWTQAIKHLPKVWKRLVHQPLWRPAVKPSASA